jgi:hypothetical protein
VEALVAARGVSASLLRAARTLGTSSHIARTLAVPLCLLGLSTAALAADVESAVRRVAAGIALFLWASIAGITLGALAALSGRLFRARGPTALFLFVIGERMVADALGLGAWSVPGALGAAFSLLMGATGIGGGR